MVAATIKDLGFTYVREDGMTILKNTLSWTTPTTYLDGVTPLALSDIVETRILLNGAPANADGALAKYTAVAGVNSVTVDGADNADSVYNIETVTSNGLVSAESNSATVQFTPPVVVVPPPPAPQAAATVTDLTALSVDTGTAFTPVPAPAQIPNPALVPDPSVTAAAAA